MADQITIASYSYLPLSSYLGAGVGIYYALPPIGEPPRAGAGIYDESRVNIPGRDNTAIVRSGFIYLPVWADMVIVNSLAASGAACKTFLAGLKQLARYNVTLPNGDSYDGCRLMRDVPRPEVQTVKVDLIAITYRLYFEQLSDTN